MNAVVLCGGGMIGAVEVGLLRALEELGIPVDLIAGTSVGAINGAYLAGGGSPAGLEQLWVGLRRIDIFPLNPAALWGSAPTVSAPSGRFAGCWSVTCPHLRSRTS